MVASAQRRQVAQCMRIYLVSFPRHYVMHVQKVCRGATDTPMIVTLKSG